MLMLFLDPLVLMLLLWLVMGDDSEATFFGMFFVALGLGVGSALIAAALVPVIGPLAIVPVLVFAVFILMKFCNTTLKQSVVILLLFGLWHVGFSFAMSSIV